ncbi:DUF222 domain-containing protein [Kribbella sp. NPDC003557]|uniref:HNH endonuclease n=1 Tax=Kribbella sp. NPDC003557 TaxID=3154449 RepID=UPI0033B3CFF0
MEPLGGRPAWSMGGSELLSTLDTLESELARLESYRLSVIAAIETTGYAEELGARDTAELLRFRYRLDAPTARRTLRLTQSATHYPTVSTALERTASSATTAAPDTNQSDDSGSDDSESADGGSDVSGDGGWLLRPAQAAAIVFGLDRVRSRVPVEHLDAAAEQLVGLAGHLSPGELRTAAKEIADLLDSDGPEPEEHKAYARESLTLSAADNGVKLTGFLACENAELLRAVVHAGARPHKTVDGEPDPRPRDKRQADALSTALSIAAAAWDTTRPTTTTAATAAPTGPTAAATTAPGSVGSTDNTGSAGSTGSAASAGSTGGAGRAGGVGNAGSVGKDRQVAGYGAKATITVTIDFEDLKAATADAIGRTVYSGGLSAATIRRLACDANIIPLVLGSNSEPLDVGRRERLVTKAMRRALDARDRGCVVCGAPPIMCDAHHLLSWIDGGDTKISNLALLCRRHHTDVHRGHWHITITNGAVHVTRPTWAEPPPTVTPAQHPTPPDTRPRGTAPPEAQPRRTAPPDTQPPGTAPQDAQPRRTAPDAQSRRTAWAGAEPRRTAQPEAQPRRTAPPDAQPRRTAPQDAQPRGTASHGAEPGGTASPGAEPGGMASPDTRPRRTALPDTQPRRTAPPDAQPAGRGTRSREAEPAEPAEPAEASEGAEVVEGVLWAAEEGGVGGSADRSRWRADVAVLRQAVDFAAIG